MCIIGPYGWMEALMGDVESEQPQEDFEVEIVDLDELASAPDSSNSSNKRLLRPSQPLRFLARRRGFEPRRVPNICFTPDFKTPLPAKKPKRRWEHANFF